jgi:hypothetical protein
MAAPTAPQKVPHRLARVPCPPTTGSNNAEHRLNPY